jgi:hypothetical protein
VGVPVAELRLFVGEMQRRRGGTTSDACLCSANAQGDMITNEGFIVLAGFHPDGMLHLTRMLSLSL